MNKKFEYIDDNPGSYFGMLVESLDNPVDVETIKSVIKGIKNNLGIDEYEIRRESKDSDTVRFRYDGKIYFAHPYSSNQVDIFDGNNNKLADKVFIDDIKETIFTESLKEDKMNESTKYEYLEKELAEVSNDKDIERAYDENELTIVKMGNVYYMEHCPDELVKKVKTLMKKYYPNLVYLYDIDLMNYSSQNESLKEDKFVPQDKMSKKAQKELNDKKRGTWGNTNPVTRVQPNKKAYDRKRDKKVIEEDFENKDSEEYLGVDEVKRFVNAREKLLDISDSMTTDLRLGRISREDVLYYRNEIKEIYSFLNSLYFGR